MPNASCTFANSILWGNTAPQYALASVPLSNNCVRLDPPGPGGTNADPMFVNAATGDYRLAPGSPCINTGDSSAVSLLADVDLAGNPRFVDSCSIALAGPLNRPAVDMGAYEVQFASPILKGLEGLPPLQATVISSRP